MPKVARKQSTGGEKSDSPKANTKKARRIFPTVSLEDALKIPLAIKTKNNGRPWESELVAKACDMSHSSAKFFYHTSAAQDYGLTIGTREAANIAITELGNAIVYAENAELEKEKKIEAF